jgi:ATP-dependent protease HslVU (ClpYQ) peptidase subunit
MTVIAWDGRTLAGDKQTSFGGLHGTSTKVHRIDGNLVGCCGNAALIQEMLMWFRNGADPEKFPENQKDTDTCATVLVVTKDRQILQYESSPYPIRIENEFWAVGSGRDYAMAAMLLGHPAAEAVECANHLDTTCGNGVDTLELAP